MLLALGVIRYIKVLAENNVKASVDQESYITALSHA